jgi:LmbE family N-acetylglucosaminyl deacetylase
MNVLVIAAHPDDEVLGCGGTIAHLSDSGHTVHIAILGEGITSRFVDRDEVDSDTLEHLASDSHKSADVLGAEKPRMFGLPDNRFDSVPLLEVVKIIEGLIDDLQPSIVFTQHGGDLNIDHVITYRATLTATRPLAKHPVEKVYAYEVQSSTEWAFQRFQPVFQPNVFADISSTLARKLEAMQHYQSEIRAFPHPRSPEALTAYAQRWGSVAGLPVAEAFELVRDTHPWSQV